jgi:uncharacterized membrane protein
MLSEPRVLGAIARPQASFGLDRWAVVLAIGLAAAGLGVAGYLTVVHFAHQPIVCNGIGDCAYVNSSAYADLAGVPVAVLGAGGYGTMLVLACAYAVRRTFEVLLAAWSVAAASFAFSMYLTYIELEVLEAICVWCVASACIATALFAMLSLVVAARWLEEEG